jgi:hypothetical protein
MPDGNQRDHFGESLLQRSGNFISRDRRLTLAYLTGILFGQNRADQFYVPELPPEAATQVARAHISERWDCGNNSDFRMLPLDLAGGFSGENTGRKQLGADAPFCEQTNEHQTRDFIDLVARGNAQNVCRAWLGGLAGSGHLLRAFGDTLDQRARALQDEVLPYFVEFPMVPVLFSQGQSRGDYLIEEFLERMPFFDVCMPRRPRLPL